MTNPITFVSSYSIGALSSLPRDILGTLSRFWMDLQGNLSSKTVQNTPVPLVLYSPYGDMVYNR